MCNKVSPVFKRRVTCDVDLFRQCHILLPYSRQHSRVVDQPADVVVDHDLPEVLPVQDVGEDEWTCGERGHAVVSVFELVRCC